MKQEEKARRYDKALERAKNFIENGDERERTIAESIFAGLMEESEDERVMKAMIDFFKHEREEGIAVLHYGVNIERMITWLEKQGKQKSAWSEEDEEEFQIAIDTLVEAGQHDSADWLKALKERYTWKPSNR